MSAFRDEHAGRLEDLGLPHLAQAVRDYRCACGCGEQLHGGGERVLYVDARHRQRAYRRRLEAEAKAAGIPARLSLETVQAARSTTARNADAQTRRAARPRRRRPGVSVYFPTLEVAELVLDAVRIADPPGPTDDERRAAAAGESGELWALEQNRAEAVELTLEAQEALERAVDRRRRRTA